jgi:hypothetical protein
MLGDEEVRDGSCALTGSNINESRITTPNERQKRRTKTENICCEISRCEYFS